LNNKETAATTTVMITKRPSLAIAAPAAVIMAATIAVAIFGLHIQVLCLQLVHIILINPKVSALFELARKIWLRICGLYNRFGGNLDNSYNSCTTKVLMSVSQE